MKELTKKVVQAGLVGQATLNLMKMWGMVDESVDDVKVAETREELLSLVDDISELLERDEIPELKETDLELDKLMSGTLFEAKMTTGQQTFFSLATIDRAGRVVFKCKSDAQCDLVVGVGALIDFTNKQFEITSVEPRYVGDTLKYYVCEVKEVCNAEVPTMW